MAAEEKEKFQDFLRHNSYVSGTYDNAEGFKKLNTEICRIQNNGKAYRLFYLALPPSVYTNVTQNIHDHCRAKE